MKGLNNHYVLCGSKKKNYMIPQSVVELEIADVWTKHESCWLKYWTEIFLSIPCTDDGVSSSPKILATAWETVPQSSRTCLRYVMSFAGNICVNWWRSEEVVWDGHRVDPSLLALDEDPVSIKDIIQESTVTYKVLS